MRDRVHANEPVTGARVALVVSRYHAEITARLERGALAALTAAGIGAEAVEVLRVPGAFEIPLAARKAAETGRFGAVVCLGCLIKGSTPHFDVIASAVAHGLVVASGDTGVPMTFGVLTTNTIEEALERTADDSSNKGWEAVAAAIEMVGLDRHLRGQADTR